MTPPRRAVVACLLLLMLAAAAHGARVVAPASPPPGGGGRAAAAPAAARGPPSRRGARAAAWGVLLTGSVGASAQHGPYKADLFEQLDFNKDGVVDKVEYMYAARDMVDARGYDSKSLRINVFDFMGQLYDACDISGDGVLSEDETNFGQYLYALEVKRRYFNEGPFWDFGQSRAMELFEGLRKDRHGEVTYESYAATCLYWLHHFRWDDLVAEAGLKGHAAMQAEEALFARADANGSGALSPREVLFGMFLIGDLVQREMAAALTKGLDRNLDGNLDVNELSPGLFRFTFAEDGLLSGAAHFMHEEFWEGDDDGDGVLNMNEVVNLCRRCIMPMTS